MTSQNQPASVWLSNVPLLLNAPASRLVLRVRPEIQVVVVFGLVLIVYRENRRPAPRMSSVSPVTLIMPSPASVPEFSSSWPTVIVVLRLTRAFEELMLAFQDAPGELLGKTG